MSKRVFVVGMVIFLVIVSCKEKGLPTVTTVIGDTEVTLEVAAEPEDLRQGLMYRDSLARNSGMLFVFPHEGVYSFWMKNTRIPLSIAFINSSGEIVGIEEMQPYDVSSVHMPYIPYRYAVEMDSGWFATHGVEVGDKIMIPQLP